MNNYVDEFKSDVQKAKNTEYRDSVGKVEEDIRDTEKAIETAKLDRRTAIKEGRIEEAISLQEQIDKLQKAKKMYEGCLEEIEYIPPVSEEDYTRLYQNVVKHYRELIKQGYIELQMMIDEATKKSVAINEMINEAERLKVYLWDVAECNYPNEIVFRPNTLVTDVLQSKGHSSFKNMIERAIQLL